MQTDTHIQVVSPYHCYDCSRHTEMNFYNYESLCQMMVNPMLATYLLHRSIWYSQTISVVDLRISVQNQQIDSGWFQTSDVGAKITLTSVYIEKQSSSSLSILFVAGACVYRSQLFRTFIAKIKCVKVR